MARKDTMKQSRKISDTLPNAPQQVSAVTGSRAPVTWGQWSDWRWHVRNQITTESEMEQWVSLTTEEKRAINFSEGRFRFSVTPYWASLMDSENFLCPIRRQSIPLDDEFRTSSLVEPFYSSWQTGKPVTARLSHPHPDRAVISLHSHCIVYCRFCPQRKVSQSSTGEDVMPVSDSEWGEMARYLTMHPEVREVILSGGEPLLLHDDLLRDAFKRLRRIPTVQTLRLETRMVSVLPPRITPELARMMKEFQPLYLVLQVNHPREVTPEFVDACSRLVDSGVPLAAQTVLLNTLNDEPHILAELFTSLFNLRIRPYRLIQCAPAQGNEHFRTSVSSGLKLLDSLRTKLGGLAMPEYVVDTAGGKIPLRYESILSRNKKRILLRNFEGKVFVYPEKSSPIHT